MRTTTRTISVTRSENSPQNRWLLTAKKVPQPSLRLFCFAHAGGSAAIYHNWHKKLPTNIEVCALQLPGRGHRIGEPLIDEFDPLIDAVTAGLKPYLSTPFAFFGHSMGAMVAFEVTRRLRAQGQTLPLHLLISGCRAPQYSLGREPIHDLPIYEFLDSLKEMNGTPAEVLENNELMEMMEPILRADFRIVETRKFREEEPLAVSLSVFGGQEDERVLTEHLQGWRQHTQVGFWQQMFPGDHFYYLQNNESLLKHVTDLLCLTPRLAIQS